MEISFWAGEEQGYLVATADEMIGCVPSAFPSPAVSIPGGAPGGGGQCGGVRGEGPWADAATHIPATPSHSAVVREAAMKEELHGQRMAFFYRARAADEKAKLPYGY